MSEFFREMVNLSNHQESERNKAFETKVNKYLSTVDVKIRKKIRRNTQYRKILVKDSLIPAKLEAINRVCNKLKEEGFSVIEQQNYYIYEFPNYRIISW